MAIDEVVPGPHANGSRRPPHRWSGAGARLLGWFAVGLGGSAVAAAVVFVARENQPWVSAATLATTLALLAIILSVFNGTASPRPVADGHPENTQRHEVLVPVLLLVPLTVTLLLTVVTMTDLMTRDGDVRAVTLWWLLGIGLLLACAWWDRLPSAVRSFMGQGRFTFTFPPFGTWGPWIGIMMLAAIPRLLVLDRYPTVMTGDEANFMSTARASSEGTLPNPFGTGFFSTPNLYLVVQGWIADFFGSDLAAHRALSAVVGVVGVMATWRLGRYLIGSGSAVVGAVILATMPFNLLFSRNALNNIVDPATIVLALLFLIRSVKFAQRRDAIACGIVLGLGFYGYYGGRAIPIVVLALLPVIAAMGRVGVAGTLRIGTWIVTGFLTTAMPLIVYYLNNPAPFAGHLDQVSSISLARLRDDPVTVMPLYLDNAWNAVMLPWVSNVYIFFNRGAPYLGWPLALLLPLGIAVWIARGVRSRDLTAVACLVVPWAMLSAGVGLTTPVGGHRLLVMTPLWALAAGSGLVLVVRWLMQPSWRPTAGPAVRVTLILATAVLAMNEARWLASEERQPVYVDPRTILAWDLGWRLSQSNASAAEQPSILFAGPPMMFSDGWGNLRFLAPDLTIQDVAEPLAERATAPELPGGTMLILIGERAQERCAVEEMHADATVAEVRAQDGSLLYLAFFHEPLTGWSTDVTPAETSVSIVTDSPCAP